MSSAVVVVWRPFCDSSLTVCTRKCKPGSIAFSSDDLPTPLWPVTTLSRTCEPFAQSVDADAGGGRHEQHFVTELRVHADERHQIGRLDEIDLVDADDRTNAALLGRDKQAIDEIRLQARFGGARDDHELIDVRNEHMLPAAAGAADHAVPRFDALDDSLFASLGAKPDDVARRDDVALIGGQRFQESAGSRTEDGFARLVAHDAHQPLHAQHATEAADGAVDVGHERACRHRLRRFRRRPRVRLREMCALAADALAVRRIDGRIRAGQLATEIFVASTRPRGSCEKSVRTLLLFRHGTQAVD